MDSALWTAKTGLEAQHTAIGIISNNLANANTTAFKRNRPEFEDLSYQVLTQPGSETSETTNSPSGVVIGTGVRLADNKKIFADGSQVTTDNPLDIAISGPGFLQVQIPNQPDMAYTRAGTLQLNEQGQLVMPNGYLLTPPITIPAGTTKINISPDGIVSVTNDTSTEQIGNIELYDFINPTGLQAVGENLYKQTVASGTPTSGIPASDGFGKLRQGALESSNVNIVEEMVNLIEAQRSFEITSKAISAIDNMLQQLSRAT